MSTRTADRYLETASARLRWRLEGAGPTIALLHGWALDLEYRDPLALLDDPAHYAQIALRQRASATGRAV